MIAHIAKRVSLIVVGYLAAIAAIGILVWASDLFVEPEGPTAFYVPQGPVVLPPEYAKLVLILAFLLLLPLLPALILIPIAEALRWRRLWIYLIGWVLVFAAITFSTLLPFSPAGTTVANLSALLGGCIYWAIAGRQAGVMKGAMA